MPTRHDKIRQVLRDFTFDTELHKKISEKVIPADDSHNKSKDDLNNHLKSLAINTESVQHEALNKMMALSFFAVRFK